MKPIKDLIITETMKKIDARNMKLWKMRGVEKWNYDYDSVFIVYTKNATQEDCELFYGIVDPSLGYGWEKEDSNGKFDICSIESLEGLMQADKNGEFTPGSILVNQRIRKSSTPRKQHEVKEHTRNIGDYIYKVSAHSRA